MISEPIFFMVIGWVLAVCVFAFFHGLDAVADRSLRVARARFRPRALRSLSRVLAV